MSNRSEKDNDRMADDKRLIEDYLPIEAIRKEAGQYFDIPAEAVDRASGGFGS